MLLCTPSLELGEAVERSPAGVPTAWRLFAIGENPLTIKGSDATLTLGEPEMRSIVEYHRKKGCKIPIDSRHFVSHLATELKRDESDILRLMPSGTATMGFGALELRPDGLWLSEVEFVPVAQELIKAGTIKYFSPVIRGLDGSEPLRVTSVALDNEPCLNHLPELSGTLTLAELNTFYTNLTKEAIMPPENKQETPLELKRDAIVREVLELSENDSPETVRGKLIALKTQAALVPGLNEKVKELELAEDQRKCKLLIAEMLEKGQLSNAQAESNHFKNATYAELSEYQKATPEGTMVPTKKVTQPERKAPEGDKSSPILKNLGLSEEDMKKMKAKEAGNGCAQ